MLNDELAVLVIDTDVYHALDLCTALQQLGARTIGPATTVDEALQFLDDQTITAAVVDSEMPDNVQPFLRLLSRRGLPFVLLCTSTLATEVSTVRPGAPILVKPIRADHVAAILIEEVSRVRSMRH